MIIAILIVLLYFAIGAFVAGTCTDEGSIDVEGAVQVVIFWPIFIVAFIGIAFFIAGQKITKAFRKN